MTLRRAMVLVLIAPLTASAQMTPLDSARMRARAAIAMLEFEWNWTRPAIVEAGRAQGFLDSTMAPPSTRILGGTGSTLILESSSAPAEALAAMRAHLLSRGLTLPKPKPRQGFVFGPPTAESVEGVLTICRDSATVRVRTRADWSGVGSLVHLRYNSPLAGSPCYTPKPGEIPWDVRAETDDIEKPLLLAPEGASSNGGHFSGGGSSSEGEQHVTAEASVRSQLSTAEMIAHYAAQLKQAGWTVEEPMSNSMIGVLTARKTDSRGRQTIATLTDLRSQRGTHRMTMRIEIPQPRRR